MVDRRCWRLLPTISETGSIRLRPAGLADVPVLQRWDTQPHVIAARGPDSSIAWRDEVIRSVPWREMLIAELDGRQVGYVEIIDPAEEEAHYWGDVAPGQRALDIWIGVEGNLGRGLGTAMMRLAVDRCFASASVNAVIIDPLVGNVRARRFYERLGFRVIERRSFGGDDCLVMRLNRADWLPTDF